MSDFELLYKLSQLMKNEVENWSKYINEHNSFWYPFTLSYRRRKKEYLTKLIEIEEELNDTNEKHIVNFIQEVKVKVLKEEKEFTIFVFFMLFNSFTFENRSSFFYNKVSYYSGDFYKGSCPNLYEFWKIPDGKNIDIFVKNILNTDIFQSLPNFSFRSGDSSLIFVKEQSNKIPKYISKGFKDDYFYACLDLIKKYFETNIFPKYLDGPIEKYIET